MYINQQITEKVKEEFYNILEQNINQIINSDSKIILRDINAKVGKEDIYKPTIGNENLHSETNNNGIQMIQFAISKGFNVQSTTVPHRHPQREMVFSKWQNSESNRPYIN